MAHPSPQYFVAVRLRDPNLSATFRGACLDAAGPDAEAAVSLLQSLSSREAYPSQEPEEPRDAAFDSHDCGNGRHVIFCTTAGPDVAQEQENRPSPFTLELDDWLAMKHLYEEAERQRKIVVERFLALKSTVSDAPHTEAVRARSEAELLRAELADLQEQLADVDQFRSSVLQSISGLKRRVAELAMSVAQQRPTADDDDDNTSLL